MPQSWAFQIYPRLSPPSNLRDDLLIRDFVFEEPVRSRLATGIARYIFAINFLNRISAGLDRLS